MAKTAIKRALSNRQVGRDAISLEPLPAKVAVFDADRIVPKVEGGTYNDLDNVRVLTPRSHMKRHGILRDREAQLEEIKSLVDDREQTMKLAFKIQNQLLAYERRTDHEHGETAEFLREHSETILARVTALERKIGSAIRAYPDPLVQSALGVKGLGELTVAALVSYVDLTKAESPSSLWCYVGLDRPAHERYESNPEQQARRKARGAAWYGGDDAVPTGWGGNKTLRTILYRAVDSMMKDRANPYRLVYDRVKSRLEVSERAVKSRNTQGNLIECAWKDTKPSHRHGAALRAMMKHLLADYWYIGRTIYGLPTRPLFAVEKLGHTGVVAPSERGWSC